MRKIKVYDKDLNEKGILDSNNIEGDFSYVVTEQGYGDLDIIVVGEPDIEHSDVVKVVDVNSFIREYYNNRYLSFDGVNDYLQSGRTINLPRRDLIGVGSFTRNNDVNGYYCEGFNNVGNGTYLDLGTPYSEINVGKAFSLKLTIMVGTGTSTRYVFHHKTFKIQEIGTEIVLGFSGGASKSFTKVNNTYYRIVISYDGSVFTVYYNGVLATGSTSVSSGFDSDYCIFGNGTGIGNPFTGGKFYGLCLRYVALTGGEITTENGAHLPQKSDSRLGMRDGDNVYFPGSGYIKFYDQVTKNFIQDTGVISGDLTATTHVCVSGRFKLGNDGTASASSQPLFCLPFCYGYVRETNNQVRIRYDNAGARESLHILGNGDRLRHHYIGVVYYTGSTRRTELYIDGVFCDGDNHAVAPNNDESSGGYIKLGTVFGGYLNGSLKDFRVHTFTGSFDSQDVNRLYNGLDPIYTTSISEYVRYNLGTSNTIEYGTKLTTIYGASIIQNNTPPFVGFQDIPIENCTYYGQVIGIVPFIEGNNGKKTRLSFIGIQTVLNNIFFRGPDNTRDRDQLMYPNETLQWIYDQNHKYMDYKGDYNLIYTQDIGFSDSSKSSEWIRSGFHMVNQSITLPDGNTGIVPLLISKGGSNFSIQNTIIVSGANASHILSFWAKSQGGNPTVTISYGILNDSFFAQETFTLSTTRRRISVNVGRGSPSGSGIMWDISYNGSGNMYIYDIKCFKELDSNIPRFSSTVLNVSYNDTKLINARQDIIQYGGGKIKWTGDEYPLCFEPDLNNDPDHYLIEGKHCIYIDRGTTSDEIINSVEVEYTGGTTSPVTDSTSISLYGKREGILQALNILDSVSAVSYGNIFLSLNKDPKVYSEIIVNGSYDIGSLRVGDLVQVNGNSIGLEKGYIVKIEMREDDCSISIGNYNSLGKVLSSLR